MVYVPRSISEVEPLLPGRFEGLAQDARAVTVASIALTDSVHPTTVESLRALLREMNSYYSNRIEGQSTHPALIADALQSNYSKSPGTARLQRLALAHINAERSLEGPETCEVLTTKFVRTAHRELYGQLPDEDRATADMTIIAPGDFRTMRVRVGHHLPPEPEALEAFAVRFDSVYARRYSLEQTLVVVAAAHHRMSWLHPFEDGNGRATRLQTHCALFPITKGLWSVSRALARNQSEYYRYLAEADAPRAGDLDGRGNLSDRGLTRWCEWFTAMCSDQVSFMSSMLKVDQVHRRIHALLASRNAADRRYRLEMSTPLFHLFAAGPTSRAEFFKMSGLGERTARSALAHLLDVGLVTSADHRGPVRIAFPLDSLVFIFPDLYPEAEMARDR